MDGIIIDGIVYEAIPKGSHHCSDCDLLVQCTPEMDAYCVTLGMMQGHRVIFRENQQLTLVNKG